MITAKAHSKPSFSVALTAKITDYVQLVKLRLSLLVVFSSIIGYILGTQGAINWMTLWLLAIGGFFVTGAANALNQLFEKDYDKLMVRTSSRPIPSGRISTKEVSVASIVMGILGTTILAISTNYIAALLAVVSLILYAFVYTPMKRYSALNVIVGAFSGALPLVIGWAAAAGTVTGMAIIVFGMQFIWQFPHTWSLAWKLDDQYKMAGMKMLPHGGNKSKSVAFQIMIYTLLLIPISLVPSRFGLNGTVSSIIILSVGLIFLFQSYKLFKSSSDKDALRLMIASIIYLPIVQLALVFGKI